MHIERIELIFHGSFAISHHFVPFFARGDLGNSDYKCCNESKHTVTSVNRKPEIIDCDLTDCARH